MRRIHIIGILLFWFSQALSQDTNNSAQIDLPIPYASYIPSAVQATQNKDYARAIVLYQKYLIYNPNDKVVSIAVIRLNLLLGNYDEGNKLLQNYLQRFGSDDAYLTEMARYYALTNQPEPALKIVEPLLKKYPNSSQLSDIKLYALKNTLQKSEDQTTDISSGEASIPSIQLPPPPALSPLLIQAQRAEADKKYQTAISLYQRYLTTNPNDKKVAIEVIRLNLLEGNYKIAESLLSNYLKKFSYDDLYLREKSRFLAFTGQSDAALKTLSPLLAKEPNNKDLLTIKQYALLHNKKTLVSDKKTITDTKLEQALAAVQQKNYKAALGYYQQYLKENPNDQKVMLDLIHLQLITGYYEPASLLLDNYKKRFKEDNNYLTEKARYYALTNNSVAALKILNSLLQKDPSNKDLLEIKQYALAHQKIPEKIQAKDPLLNQAVLAFNQKEYSKAITLYQQYLKANPQDKKTTLDLIRVYLIQGQYQAANDLLITYKSKFNEDDDYLTEQARYYALTNNSELALKLLTSLLQQNPDNKDLLEIKQYALTHKAEKVAGVTKVQDELITAAEEEVKKKNIDKAINLYRQYLEKNNSDKEQYIVLIRLLLMQAKYDEANKLLENYQHLFSKDNDYLIEKARYYALTNKSKEALAILAPLLAKDPGNATLLDIKKYALTHKEAKTKETKLSTADVELLRLAADLCSTNPYLYEKAAKGYIAIKNHKKALVMIDKAILLNCKNESFLELRVEIGKALERQDIVYWSYNELYFLNPTKRENILGLARASSAQGCLDIPSCLYLIYISYWPYDPKPWLEYAYIESWKGNSRRAINLLNHYYWLFGTSDDYLVTRANVVASANHPYEALDIIEPLMCKLPDNYDLNYARTVALYYGNRPIQMFQSLARVNNLKPGTNQTLGLNAFVSTPFRSRVTADGYDSFDTDTVKITWGMLTGQLFISPLTSIITDFKKERLSASISSGLAPITGGKSIYITQLRVGGSHRFNPNLLVRAVAGSASATKDGGTYLVYQVDAPIFINDRLRADLLLSHDFYDVSARAVSLGIRRRFNQIAASWEPKAVVQTYINARAAYAFFSDDNEMKLFEIYPKTYIIASELVNVVVGADALWYGFNKQLSHGYYNPANYEFYAVNTNITFKQNENINYVVSISLGTQKDETFVTYKPANDYSAKAFIGIYQDWYLVLAANASTRGRAIANNVDQDNYEVYSFLASLTRRF